MAHGHLAAARQDRTRLVVALALAGVTALVEVVGGRVTGSLSLLADATHVVGDASALLLALLAVLLGARPHSARWTFGFHRVEILAAGVNGLTLLALAGLIGWQAVHRIQLPGAVAGGGLLLVASFGLVANIAQFAILRRGQSLNMRAARLHVLSDLAGSIAAVTAGVMVSVSDEPRFDSVATLVIVVLIAVGAARLLREAAGVLLVRAPEGLDLAAVERALLTIEGVRAVHDVHAWTVASGFVTFDCHIELSPGVDAAAAVELASRLLRDRFDLNHVTIQPERPQLLELEGPRS